MTFLYDFAPAAIENGRARITPEGYFVADALVGRANNIQEYRAAELGDEFSDLPPGQIVRVFRPETEVFALDSLASASRLPITLDHPVQGGRGVMVDAKNFREFARGETGEEILRDGQFIRVPIRVTDAQAVDSVRTDRREFSLGYRAKIRRESGVHDGQPYDAILSDIRYNHLAACRAARGGPELRITDERPANMKGAPMLILIDGLQVDVSNAEVAATTVRNLIAARDSANAATAAAEAALTDARNQLAQRDAEIVGLKDAADKAKPTPAALRDAAAAYARTADKAKALGVTVTDEMDVDAMRAAAVAVKMGDAAKGYTPEQIAAAFDVLAANVADAAPANSGDPLRAFVRDSGTPANAAGDAMKEFADARAARLARFETAHKGTAAA